MPQVSIMPTVLLMAEALKAPLALKARLAPAHKVLLVLGLYGREHGNPYLQHTLVDKMLFHTMVVHTSK
jgi:hypothetical protein